MQPRPLTDEEKRAAQWRSVAQKIETAAQGVLYNLTNNPAAVEACTDKDGNLDLSPLVTASVKAGAQFAREVGDTLGVIYRDLFEAPKDGEKKEEK